MTKTPEKVVYSAVAQTSGGRDGVARTFDPDLELSLSTPAALGGSGQGSNPEQLFAMGYGACFQGALGLAARESGADITGSLVRTTVGIGPEGDSFGLTVLIEVAVPGLPLDQVQALADRTHQLCPYSKAVSGNIPVQVVAVPEL